MRAENFTQADLPELMAWLHERGVRGYVTLNTLIFTAELTEVETYLKSLIQAGVDAAIVQDVGLCRLIRHLSPNFPIHASTQMTITSAAGVGFAKELGCNLVVLARECSLQEIEKIQSQIQGQPQGPSQGLSQGLSQGKSQGQAQGQSPNPTQVQGQDPIQDQSPDQIQNPIQDPIADPVQNQEEDQNQNKALERGTDETLKPDIDLISGSIATSGSEFLADFPAESIALPLEVFVHGALCVAYSGQCLTSESLGGRSANRGECAQACRMPYELVVDGVVKDLGDRRYLLSPQDLAGLELLPELLRSGVSSLKIEGRLKAPEYVAAVTRVYRQALDNLAPSSTQDRYDLEMAFSRGLYTGWFGGIDNQQLVHGRFGKKRGVYVGQVARVTRQGVVIKAQDPVKAGDGVVFDRGQADRPEQGGRVYGVETHSHGLLLTFGAGAVDLRQVRSGDQVWKTSDPDFDRRVRSTYSQDQPQVQRPLQITVQGSCGQPLSLTVRDDQGHCLTLQSQHPLEAARNQPLTVDRLRQQLGRLGNTPFYLETLHAELDGTSILPLKELNRLRRQFVEALTHRRRQPRAWTLNPQARWQDLQPDPTAQPTLPRSPQSPASASTPSFMQSPAQSSSQSPAPSLSHASAQSPVQFPAQSPEHTSKSAASATVSATVSATTSSSLPQSPPSGTLNHLSGLGKREEFPVNPSPSPELRVLVRNLAQLDAALTAGVSTLYCELEDPRQYQEIVARVRATPVETTTPQIFVAPPRITKPKERWILDQVRRCGADGYLIRNYDHLQYFHADRCIGDFSLNVANPLTAAYFHDRFGLERLTASYDLNTEQLADLLRHTPPHWLEVTIHQHMPMFHMEHCVFCAFLSEGKDFRDCGRPCDHHSVKLRDRTGREHPLQADAGCRNTVFNATAQTGAESVADLRQIGLYQFRLEFLQESPETVAQTIHLYQQLLRDQISGHQLWQRLKSQSQVQNQLGVTRGTHRIA